MHNRFLEGFLKSWGVIIASEIGDKTFFIAAVMAMKNSRREVRWFRSIWYEIVLN
jgi:putative Ca2+/H+ antiporter (TMEM165/GDT1 family)